MRLFELAINEISKSYLKKSSHGILEPTPKNIQMAKNFVLMKWKERAKEKKLPLPVDLSNACKFNTLFIKKIFGGKIKGNYNHQYNVIDGKIIDLSDDSSDVILMNKPYEHDEIFFGNPEHIESLKSCQNRVDQWVDEFLQIHSNL
ncbi:MAG: hypothetical protein WC284_13455 [Candidimonas sp.]